MLSNMKNTHHETCYFSFKEKNKTVGLTQALRLYLHGIYDVLLAHGSYCDDDENTFYQSALLRQLCSVLFGLLCRPFCHAL